MLIYHKREDLLYHMHTLTMIFYIAAVFLSSLLFSHPLLLAGMFAAVSVVIISIGIIREWLMCLKISLAFILVLMVINAVFSKAGVTVLLWGPEIYGLGRIRITLEALCYGAGMGFRLLLIISAFCLYTYVVDPDRVIKIFGKRGGRSALAISMAVRLFPLMISDYKRIVEIQRCRGVNFNHKRFWQRAKKSIAVINVMLLSSLERSFQQAEALHARGYGVKDRTYYNNEYWKTRDVIMNTVILLALMVEGYLYVRGLLTYVFYPRLQVINYQDLVIAGLISVLFMFPAFLNWGWKYCPLLKSRI